MSQAAVLTHSVFPFARPSPLRAGVVLVACSELSVVAKSHFWRPAAGSGLRSATDPHARTQALRFVSHEIKAGVSPARF